MLLTGIADHDELAMPLVGAGADEDERISGFDRTDFVEAMIASGVNEKIADRIIDKMTTQKKKMKEVVDSSFLSEELKLRYKTLIEDRIMILQNGRKKVAGK